MDLTFHVSNVELIVLFGKLCAKNTEYESNIEAKTNDKVSSFSSHSKWNPNEENKLISLTSETNTNEMDTNIWSLLELANV